MMKRSSLIFILILQFCFFVSSTLADRGIKKTFSEIEISNRIEIVGNRFFEEEKLLSHLKLKPGLAYSDDL
ncbi:MAG: hypothetical protein ACE5K2_04080, partial [Candidatus Zixiibacteriota bacterium]